MRVSIAILMILGACIVVSISLLSVLHDLLIRIPRRYSAYANDRHPDHQSSAVCSDVSEDIQ
jgi:hypothetical protein